MVQRMNFIDGDRTPEGDGAEAPCANSRSMDLQIVYLPIEHLRAFVNNARTHSKKQLKQIAQSIERFGFVNPVLISDDCEIVAGHGRVEAAKMLGLREVPTVRLSNLSPAERRAYVIADNRLAQLAGWDREVLAAELEGLHDLQFDDVELTGFSLGEIDLLRNEMTADTATATTAADQRPLNRSRPAVSRPGDQWVLGPHRLLCGNAGRDCDVVVRRWQQYTGQSARLEGSVLTFADVAAHRLTRQSQSPNKAEGSE
jgi:ParB-like nuclease domain